MGRDGSIEFDAGIKTGDIEKDLEKIEESISGTASEAEKRAEEAYNIMLAQAKKLAAEYEKSGMKSSEALRKAWNDMKGTAAAGADSVKQTASRAFDEIADSAESALSDSSQTIDDFSDKIKDALAAAGTIAGAAEIVKVGTDYDKAMQQVAASTGAAGKELENLQSIASNVYNNNFGDSMEDAAAGVTEIYKRTGLVEEELQKATESAYLLRDTFGYEITESTQAASQLMKVFGVTADEAYTLIAQGAQQGLDQNGDMLDVLNEYSVQFAGLGYSAEDMFNMLKNGVDTGTWSVDKLGDAVKEMNIRLNDGTADEALQALGLGFTESAADAKLMERAAFNVSKAEVDLAKAHAEAADVLAKSGENSLAYKEALNNITQAEYDLADAETAYNEAADATSYNLDEIKGKLAAGGEAAQEAQQQILTALMNVEDEQERYVLGQTIMGTMWEDLGEDAVNALMNTQGAISKTKDTLEDMAEVKYNDLESQFESLRRQVETEVIVPLAKEFMPEIKEAMGWVSDNLDEIITYGKPIATALAAAFATTKIVEFGSSAVKTIKTVKAAFTALNTSNPLGWITLGVSAVVGLGTAIAAETRKWKEHLDDVRESAAKLPDEVEEIKDAVSEAAEEWDKMKESSESAISDAEFDYSNIQNLKDRLADLVNADGTIKEGCETEVSNIIDKINGYTDACYEVSNGLILKNDKVIGSYQNLSAELDELIEKTHAIAIINAYQDDYETAVSDKVNAEYAIETAKDQIDSLIPQLQDAERKLVELKAQADANPFNLGLQNRYSEAVAYAEGLREQIDTEYGLLTDAARLNAEYQSVISNYDNAYDAYMKDDLEGMQKYGAALQNGIVNAVSEEDILAIEDNIERLTKLKERAETLYEANPTDENADMLNEAKEALAAQQAEQEEYYELFGAQGAEYAHALEEGFTEALQWDTTSEAMMNAMMGSLTYETEKQLPQIEGIADTIEEPFAGLPDSMFVDGANAGQGLADGMLSKADEVAAASNSLAYIAENGFTGPLDIRSPSRVMAEAATFAGEGVVVGLDESVPLVDSASQNLAQSLVSGFDGVSSDMADAAVAATLGIMNAQGASSVSAYSPVFREAYTSPSVPETPVTAHPDSSQGTSAAPKINIYIGDEEIRGFIVSAVVDENANSGGWSI